MTAFGKLVVAGVLMVLAGIGAGVYYLAHRTSSVAVACTEEAMLCPDGSYVGRTGPDCVFAPCPSATSTLAADVYPLYSAATWQSVASASFTIGTTTVNGTIATSTPSATTSNIASTTGPFINYYDGKLTAAGWSQDTQLDADGAGSSVRVYKKGTGVIVISYTSDFKNISEDTPAQCPCAVSFSVFTSTAVQ